MRLLLKISLVCKMHLQCLQLLSHVCNYSFNNIHLIKTLNPKKQSENYKNVFCGVIKSCILLFTTITNDKHHNYKCLQSLEPCHHNFILKEVNCFKVLLHSLISFYISGCMFYYKGCSSWCMK